MRFVEETGGSWTEQLRCAEAEIEQQRREWEANRLAALRKEEEDAKRAEEEENQLLTYSGADARNQVNNKSKKPVNRNLGRNKRLTNMRRQNDIVKSNRRSNNETPSRRSQSNRRSQSATLSPKKRKIEETSAAKNQTVPSRSIPKRLCRQTNNSRSETTDNENDVSSDGGNASSNESKKGTSDSFVDSDENSLDVCSLDVMYDEQQSESNSNQASASPAVDNEKSDNSDNNSNNAESDSDINGKESNDKQESGDKRGTTSTNRLDINSPRTRSRGTVKLDLWSLDDSPILPSFGGRSKRNQTKSLSNDLNETIVQLKSTCSRSNSPSVKSNGNDESTVRSRRNRSKSQSNERIDRSRSKSLSNDVDGNATDGSKNHLTEELNESSLVATTPRTGLDEYKSNHKVTQDRRNTITVMKLAQIKDGLDGSRPLKAKRPAVAKKTTPKNGKSSSTLDSWLSSSKSAKIVLNKDDDAIAKHLTEMARRTRRASTLKLNSENGPS